jgi:hypothetical protein
VKVNAGKEGRSIHMTHHARVWVMGKLLRVHAASCNVDFSLWPRSSNFGRRRWYIRRPFSGVTTMMPIVGGALSGRFACSCVRNLFTSSMLQNAHQNRLAVARCALAEWQTGNECRQANLLQPRIRGRRPSITGRNRSSRRNTVSSRTNIT